MMDKSGHYYTASSASEGGGNNAITHLSTPLDLTKDEFEIGLVYCSVISSWLYSDDLWLVHSSLEKDTSDLIQFQKIPYTKEHESLWLLSSRLAEEYGCNMDTAPAKIFKNAKTSKWTLRLPKQSMLDLSPDLAYMLGLDKIVRNDTDKVADLPINFQVYAPYLDERLFFVSCDEIVQNFTNTFGSNNRILSFVHAPEADTYVISDYTTARLAYCRLEGNLLHNITFSLLNYRGEPIHLEKYNFFVVFHIRPVNNGFERSS